MSEAIVTSSWQNFFAKGVLKDFQLPYFHLHTHICSDVVTSLGSTPQLPHADNRCTSCLGQESKWAVAYAGAARDHPTAVTVDCDWCDWMAHLPDRDFQREWLTTATTVLVDVCVCRRGSCGITSTKKSARTPTTPRKTNSVTTGHALLGLITVMIRNTVSKPSAKRSAKKSRVEHALEGTPQLMTLQA